MDFFRKGSVISKPPTADHAALQAQLLEIQAEERKLRDRCQKLELEKSLLQNFVDQVYNQEDGSMVASSKKYTEELHSQNVTLQQELSQSKEDCQELRTALELSQKKCAAFEAALQNATEELKAADMARVTDHAQSPHRIDASSDTALEGVRRVLAEREETISQLMERISKADADHKLIMKDYEVILSKSSEAHTAALDELDDKSRELSLVTSACQAHRNRIDELGATIEAFTSKNVAQEHLVTFLSSCMASALWIGEMEVEAFIEMFSLARDAEIEYSNSVLSSWSDDCRSKAGQIATLEERLTMKESRIIEARAFLQQSAEKLDVAEKEIRDLEKQRNDLQSRVEDLIPQLESSISRGSEIESTMIALLQDNETMKETIMRSQQQFQLKSKQSAQIIRDLQEQLSGDGPHRPSSSASPGIQNSEVESLLERVTSLQERVWLLENAKSSYESEIDRLTKDAQERWAIIRTHFHEAAEKVAKQKGKFGSSLFRRTNEEVESQVQEMLQEALIANLRLENQVRDLSRVLETKEALLAQAEGLGLVVDAQCPVSEEVDPFS